MDERSSIPKDELYREHAGNYQGKLAIVANNLEEAVNNPEILSTEADRKIETFAEENSERLPEILEEFLEYYLSLESSRSSGHEASHVYDNLASALQSFRDSNLSEASKLEIALACIGHDLGRHVEPSMPEVSKSKTELLMPYTIGRKLAQSLGFPNELGLRIIYDIANAKKKPGRVETDIVGQCDRVYALGAPVFIRDLAFGLIRETEDYPMRVPTKEEMPDYENYGRELQNPYSNRVPLKHFHFEFMMRNVFPPVSENMTARYDRSKVETAVILMIASIGRPDVYNVFFAPEEGLATEEKLGRFKRPLDPELYKLAKREFDSFMREVDPSSYQAGDELLLTKQAMAIEKIIPPENFDEIFASKVSTYSATDRKNLWLQIHYAIRSRHEDRLRDLQEMGRPFSPIEQKLSEWIRRELDDREMKYQDLYQNRED